MEVATHQLLTAGWQVETSMNGLTMIVICAAMAVCLEGGLQQT